ncbi:recombinase family protein [Serinicoccus sediminis]|uniref:recombinase family protein n=1 Tax=Serinicoccus sediminis TaxID=2306021 RepID=UPI0013ED7A29|nr:recombinase family protein [Serinicoccus sediminis]
MRALIYARVSLDLHEGRSTAEQEAECRAWADREGWDVTRVITETGSASRYASGTRARTRWADLTAAITSGQHDILLTWEASRATRQLAEYAELADLCATHHVLWGYSGTVHDLATRDARFRTGLDALLAQDESARTSERVRRSSRARAAAGRPHGKLPYGYRREYDPTSGALLRQVPDEDTAPIVREIYARILDGDGCATIAKDLTRRDITPPRPPTSRTWPAQQWLPVTVKRIGTSPTYAARRVHQGTIVGDADWPPLVTVDTWERAVAVLTDPARNTRTGDSTATHLLTGIATCGVCGAPVRRIKNRGIHSYACPRTGCMAVVRSIAPTEAWVTDVLLELLTVHGAQLAAGTTTDDRPDVTAARDELQGLRTRLDGFVSAAADGQVSPATLATIEARLTPQIRAAESRVRQLLTPRALDGIDLTDPAAAWDGLDLAERRHLLRSVVDVVIHRRTTRKQPRVFERETVVVTPRW